MAAVLGIDFGTKRVGLAVTDPGRTFVFPRDTLLRTTPERDVARIRELCAQEGVDLLVVGLPLNVDGSEGPMAQAARAFGTQLADALGLPVTYADERYTSLEAEEHLRERYVRDTRKRRALRDRAAAVIILRGWLDSPSPGDRPLPPA